MKTRIINLISGPGSGKSLMSALVFVELKLRGYTVEFVQEYAKNLVWTQDFDTLNNQQYVSLTQYKLFKAIVDTNAVDFIITDGSLLHGLYYNRHNPDNLSNVEKTERLILQYYHSFDNINIVLKRGNYEYETAGRIQTKQEAKEVDIELRKILTEYRIQYTEVVSDVKAVKEIVDAIEAT